MASLYTVKGVLVLDNDGNRILCQYYDDTYATVKEQRAFEKSLFQKTHRSNSEIVMFDGLTCVYRSNVDLFFYVFGSASENELILASVLHAFYDAVAFLLRDNIEKRILFEHIDAVMLVVDEMIDGGIILETDPIILAKSATGSAKEKDVPLSEQTLSQALNTAGGLLRRSLLT
eukprot:m.289709 g.289709  ORF g.289709 m.289709 type:complete len:174 (+) comp12175_c0_seq1:29-550(+)